MASHPYVITVSSEKGGVGKTTLATNLAIFLKAFSEDLPVSIISFDNHCTVDRMFEIKGQALKGDVADFLGGRTGADVLHTGQYGVDYIPSSKSLHILKQGFSDTLQLTRLISASRIPGILIIDTRPDLDILTQNALFAADKVLIPVKDMASLENCRNIFELFDKKGFDKKSLSLVPCIIDSRIKFEGPFLDQRSLLRAYAINRGYRCTETYISKSPKVESLGTNPSGKVYPILTHARNTEVYGQFVQLTGSVLHDFNTTASPRSRLFQQWLETEEKRNRASFADRRSGLRSDCLLCGRRVLDDSTGSVGFYFETSDGAARGFLDYNCFSALLLTSIFNLGKDFATDSPGYHLLKEAMHESSFVFRQTMDNTGALAEFTRVDQKGYPLGRKLYPLREFERGLLNRQRSRLYTLLSESLQVSASKPVEPFLLVHPVNPLDPEGILREENYRAFSKLRNKIGDLMSMPMPLNIA